MGRMDRRSRWSGCLSAAHSSYYYYYYHPPSGAAARNTSTIPAGTTLSDPKKKRIQESMGVGIFTVMLYYFVYDTNKLKFAGR